MSSDLERNKSGETCTRGPAGNTLTEVQLGGPIWSWLNAHPKLGGTNANQALTSAMHAVYPCV